MEEETAGRVGPRFPSSSSHLPSTKPGGILCEEPTCVPLPRAWAGETAFSSLEEPCCEGSCDWGEGKLRRRGEGACAGGNALGAPARTGSPCLGWVSAFRVLHLWLPRWAPSKAGLAFDFNVLGQVLCGHLASSSASVSPSCPQGPYLTWAGLGPGRSSWAVTHLKDLLSSAVDLPSRAGLTIAFSPPKLEVPAASHSPHLL